MEQSHLHIELFEALHRLGHTQMADFGPLTKVEFFTLSMLVRDRTEHPERSGMYVSELAERMHCSSPAASRTLRHLEERGLLRREVDRADRRSTFVILTGAGEQALQESWSLLNAAAVHVTQRMGEANMRNLIDQLNRLADIILEEQQRSELNAEYSQVSEKTRRLSARHRSPAGGTGIL